MIRDMLIPDAGWKLEAPHALHGRMRDWARVGSPTALFGGGVLIGLCTVPCSGAVYLGVVALLVVLLALASRPGLIRVINRWHLEHAGGTKLLLAIVVLLLGFAILITV